MTCRLREIGPADFAAWDAFVAQCPDATFFHRVGWKRVIEGALGHACPYLVAERDGEIVGVLPLTLIDSRLFGRALVSTAFCVYGGPVGTDDAARAALLDYAVELARDHGVGYLELRNRTRMCPGWPAKNETYVTFRKAMEQDVDANMKAIPRKQRAMVRKGIKFGLVGEIDMDVRRFYPVYAESVRNLGTPVFPQALLTALKEVFADDCEVLIVTHDGQPVAGVMSFYFRDEVLPYYGGGGGRARALAANDFMYWEVMRRACTRGARVFDFGRSKAGTGAYHFKKHWGFEPRPLHYEYYLNRDRALPDLSPLNPKYRLMIATWRRLPLWLANRLGPVIARNLG